MIAFKAKIVIVALALIASFAAITLLNSPQSIEAGDVEPCVYEVYTVNVGCGYSGPEGSCAFYERGTIKHVTLTNCTEIISLGCTLDFSCR